MFGKLHNNMILLHMSIFFSDNEGVKIPHLNRVGFVLSSDRKRLLKQNNVKVKMNKELSNEYYIIYEGDDDTLYVKNNSEKAEAREFK